MKTLTEKEKKLVEAYAKNGGNGTKAVLEAYDTKDPKRAATLANSKLKTPKIQDALRKELKKQGITLSAAVSPISKGLKAKKRGLDGKILRDENRKMIDDLDVQLRASDRALRLLLPKEKTDFNFNLNIDSAHFGGEFVIDGEIKNE